MAKKDRPKSPEPDHCRYHTKQALAIDKVRAFVAKCPEITIEGVLADALYGTGDFMDQVKRITGNDQELQNRVKPIQLMLEGCIFMLQGGIFMLK